MTVQAVPNLQQQVIEQDLSGTEWLVQSHHDL